MDGIGRAHSILLLAVGLSLAACGDDGGITPPDDVSFVVLVGTTGPEPDPDGYIVELTKGGTHLTPRVTDRLALALQPGTYDVTLTGVAANCSVAPPNPRSVTLASATTTTFQVSCQQLSGAVHVSTQTTGKTRDVAYSIKVDGELYCGFYYPSCAFFADEPFTISGLLPGDHSFELSDIPADCSLSGPNPRTASVRTAETTELLFEISCVATP